MCLPQRRCCLSGWVPLECVLDAFKSVCLRVERVLASDFGYIQSRLGGCGAFAAFEQAAHRWPDNTATFGATASFTYSDTLNAAVALADQLYASDLRAGDYVGIEVSRSHQAVVAMLACARLDLCFVPLDAGYAAEQIEFILNALPLSAVLVADHGSRVAPHLPARCLALYLPFTGILRVMSAL